jgi:glycosyltransferase involved in cell wall biosynthesis
MARPRDYCVPLSRRGRKVIKICIVTNGTAAAEPRAMKQALALKRRWPAAEVVLCDAYPRGEPGIDPDWLSQGNIARDRREFPTRRNGLLALAFRKMIVSVTFVFAKYLEHLRPSIFGVRAVGLSKYLESMNADIYISHGIDTLLPAYLASRVIRGKLVFDSMEYYSGMGDGQNLDESALVKKVESLVLKDCSLVFTASDGIAEALVNDYGITRPIPVYNTPRRRDKIPEKSGEFSLYWRNYQIGFGQRGLDDVLVALTMLPVDIKLYLQGKPPWDGGAKLHRRITELKIEDRVFLKPPFFPGDEICQAAPHTIGLCLERRGPANHEYTVSNKIFDYLMAGLVVIASDLPGLRNVVDRSAGGLLYPPGSPEGLACAIKSLYNDRIVTANLSKNAREFALTEANEEIDMEKFVCAFENLIN